MEGNTGILNGGREPESVPGVREGGSILKIIPMKKNQIRINVEIVDLKTGEIKHIESVLVSQERDHLVFYESIIVAKGEIARIETRR